MIVFPAVPVPAGTSFSEGSGFPMFGGSNLIDAIRDFADAIKGNDINIPQITVIPGLLPVLAQNGAGGYLSPSLVLFARAGCDVCDESVWEWLEDSSSGLIRNAAVASLESVLRAEDDEIPTIEQAATVFPRIPRSTVRPNLPRIPKTPTESPGPGWEWRGTGPVGSDKGRGIILRPVKAYILTLVTLSLLNRTGTT
jgi:hypothetical protein